MIRTAVILGGGPSLVQADVDYCRTPGVDVLAINNAWQLAPWARWLYACDRLWWDHYHAQALRAPIAEYWTSIGDDEEPRNHWGVRSMRSVDRPGLCLTPGTIHQGKNSGYQALNLLYHFGLRRIILLGYDMSAGHWHGDHPAGFAEFDGNACRPLFDLLAVDLAAAGIEVINSSRETTLTVFPRAPLREVL